MTVAIIGSGKMGSGFARLLASKGFDVSIGNKNPEKSVTLAEEIGAGAKGGSVKDAVRQADVVILAVKYEQLLPSNVPVPLPTPTRCRSEIFRHSWRPSRLRKYNWPPTL